MTTVCIYHSPCNDGYAAALACWLENPDAIFIPCQYGTSIWEALAAFDLVDPGKLLKTTIYILDFSFPRDQLKWLGEQVKKVVVIDHHKTARDDLEGGDLPENVHVIFDMNKSGAVLSFLYFTTRPLPRFYRLIQDRDLWRWDYGEETKALHAYLMSYRPNFRKWYQLFDEHALRFCISEGKAILHYMKLRVEDVEVHAHPVMLPYKGSLVEFLAVNAPGHMASDVADSLKLEHPDVLIYQMRADRVILSFRSTQEGLDVSRVALEYNGGGHEHAAGGWCSIEDWANIMKKEGAA